MFVRSAIASTVYAVTFIAAIVGAATPAYATACECSKPLKTQAGQDGHAGVSAGTPRATPSPAVKAIEPPPARRSIEIEFNFFGRKYSVEFITTSDASASDVSLPIPVHSAPDAPPVAEPAPAALG
jgi:hypothetical protein